MPKSKKKKKNFRFSLKPKILDVFVTNRLEWFSKCFPLQDLPSSVLVSVGSGTVRLVRKETGWGTLSASHVSWSPQFFIDASVPASSPDCLGGFPVKLLWFPNCTAFLSYMGKLPLFWSPP